MTSVPRSVAFPAILIAIGVLASPGAAGAELDVSADTPDVDVSTRPAGRNFLSLPTLRFNFVIAARCPGPGEPVSFSLSVADTRVSLDADRLEADGPLEFAVTVPASQIGPVAVDDFCAIDAGERMSEDAMRIPAVLSAQVSLLCESDAGSKMTYASESLDVTLHCETGGDAE